MSADSDALAAVKALPGLTEGEQQYLLTVARGEGFYGLGWDNPNPKTVSESAQFGLTGHEGKGSRNWGAVQGAGSAGSFFHVDHHADGTVYKGTFKKYGSDTEAAADVARILLKPNVKAAIATGSLRAAVFAQHDNKYFELNPEAYLSSVAANYSILTKSIGWNPLLKNTPKNPLSPAEGEPAVSPPPQSGLPSSSQAPAPSTVPETLPIISLERKSTGTAVKLWQRYLKSLGMAIIDTGSFDTVTDQYTRLYQANRGLPVDGDVGPKTWNSAFR